VLVSVCGRWWPPEWREVEGDGATSVVSREGQVMGDEVGYFSDADEEPREVDLVQYGPPKEQVLMLDN
jgi:hypothetical protein